MSNDISYDILVKVVNNFPYRQAIVNDVDTTLANEGLKDTDQIAMLKGILTPLIQGLGMDPVINDCQVNEMVEHYDTLSKLRIGLNETIKQMLDGYARTMLMYTISFYMGVLMILLAVIFAITKGEALLPIVFAGLGTVDIVGHFITNPPLKLQKSRADLAQLQAAYFTWYQDFRHWQGFLFSENTKYMQGIITTSDFVAELRQVSDAMMNNTKKTLGIIEKFAEIVEKKEIQSNAPNS